MLLFRASSNSIKRIQFTKCQTRNATIGQVIVGSKPFDPLQDKTTKNKAKRQIFNLYKERYLDKLPSSIVNKKKSLPLKYKRWKQPEGLTPEQQKQNAIENPKPFKKVREGQQIFIDNLKDASEKKLITEVFDNYQRIQLKYCDSTVFTAVLKACECDGGYLGEAIQVYHDMKRRNIQVNVSQYLSLVKTAASAEHLPRVIYFIKEFLLHSSKVKKDDKLLEMFEVGMKLAIDMQRPDKAMSIYIHANGKLLYKKRQDALEFRNGRLPLSYVKSLLPAHKQEEAYDLHKAMIQSRSPSFMGDKKQEQQDDTRIEVIPGDNQESDYYAALRIATNSDIDPYAPLHFDQHRTIQASAYVNDAARYQQLGYELPVATKSTHFTFDGYSVEPQVNLLNDTEWQNNYVKLVKTIVDYMELDTKGKQQTQQRLFNGIRSNRVKGSKVEHNHLIKSIYDQYITKYFYCTEELEVQALKKKMREDLADVSRKLQLRRNWIPIIVGVDTMPFFPTSLGFDLLNKENIEEAKREYLDSIPDPESREIIKSELSHKIQLRWYDVDTRTIVEGLVY
ncbi:pentatricopeptide repeat-containing protein [Acrasis kona]|uniref:Pentatricopeptide repeat-containing protein n=1 Tax=Acrasis kona TaxID=1008807 RepID=A0AAW2YYI5_9EUKA